jgi:hypothetical protein
MGESKVVAVREALDHPQILGTNRHIMCGMMDVSKTQWNEKEKSLIFNASVVEGEEMIITTILPKDRALRPTSISGEGVDTTFSDSGKVLKISIKSPKSLDVQITLGFE